MSKTQHKHAREHGLWHPAEEANLLTPDCYSLMGTYLREVADEAKEQRLSQDGFERLKAVTEWADDCHSSMSVASGSRAEHWQWEVSQQGRLQFQASALLASFQVAQSMSASSREMVNTSISDCVRATMPPSIQTLVLQMLEAGKFPGKETVREASLSVDAAFLLHQRRHVSTVVQCISGLTALLIVMIGC